MLDDGSWAYVSKEVLPADGGDLVVFADTDGRESHLFVVQATYGWGALLHRLDRQPISETLRGSFAKTEACYGTGPTSACVDSAPKGTVFSVFAANNGRLLLQDGHPRRVARLRSQDPASSVWAAPAAEWIAVKDAVLGQTPVFQLGDEGCSLTMPGVSKLTLPSSHPLNVEQAAYDSLVDGFVRCADGEVRVRIPSATRATLPSRDPRLRTHPVLSIMADRVEGEAEVAFDVRPPVRARLDGQPLHGAHPPAAQLKPEADRPKPPRWTWVGAAGWNAATREPPAKLPTL